MTGVYVDTSALAKWYFHEARSDEVEAYLQRVGPVDISTLTMVEMRSLVARRRRAGEIDASAESRVLATFDDDVKLGHLIRNPVDDDMVQGAVRVLGLLPDHPLRSLDALHLSVARGIAAGTLVTADRIMGEAGEALHLAVVRFD